jgi:pre-rRNA-processing protein TSR4
MPLLLQLHGDLPEFFPGHERRLYIFGCRQRMCRRVNGSIKAIRSVRRSANAPADDAPKYQDIASIYDPSKFAAKQNLGNSIFGVISPASEHRGKANANPFSSSIAAERVNPFSSPTSIDKGKGKAIDNPFSSSTAAEHVNPFSSPSPGGSPPPTKIDKGKGKATDDPFPPSTTAELVQPFSSLSTGSPPLSPNPYNTPLPPSPSNYFAAHPVRPPATELPKTFAQKLSIGLPQDPPMAWPAPSGFPIPYPHYHLDADYETLDAPPHIPIQLPPGAIDKVDMHDPKDNSKGKGKGKGESKLTSWKEEKEDAETFESSMDKTFQQFADRLAQNPLQVLRYEFTGTPLLYSKSDAVGKSLTPYLPKQRHSKEMGYIQVRTATSGFGAPPCGNCGTHRAFELQLTPQAIMELEAEEEGVEGMEWGTVILGVCGKDCGGERGVVESFEEWVGVQWEERGRG